MINRETFYENIKAPLFNGALSSLQIDTINSIFDESESQNITDNRQIAYMLGTSYLECHNPHHPELRLTPMKEFGGETYLKSKDYYPYYGRGLSQITHLANYKRESLRTGIDLVKNPDAILSLPLAANSHVYNMVHGLYTGKKLSDYINNSGCNFESARKIINPKDFKTYKIVADYAKQFLAAMQ